MEQEWAAYSFSYPLVNDVKAKGELFIYKSAKNEGFY